MRDPLAVDLLVSVILSKPQTRAEEETAQRARFHVTALLKTLGDPRAVDLLGNALRDSRPMARLAALKVLGALQDVRAVEPLATYVKENDADVSSEAVEVLRRMGDEAIAALRARVEGQDPIGNLAVVRVLAAVGDTWSIDQLLELVANRSRDDDTGSAAAIALRQLAGKGAAGPLGERRDRVLERLASFLKEEAPLGFLIYEFNHVLDEEELVQTGEALARIGAAVEPFARSRRGWRDAEALSPRCAHERR
jgi:HEAT repeat protein